jgi:hypothetical protein
LVRSLKLSYLPTFTMSSRNRWKRPVTCFASDSRSVVITLVDRSLISIQVDPPDVFKKHAIDPVPTSRVLSLTSLSPSMTDARIATTYGAFLLGSFSAFALSGFVTLQTYIYFKLFPEDNRILKYMVATIWITDSFHSTILAAGLWDNMISRYGDPIAIDAIPWTIAMTVGCTAVITFMVHGFFAHRIYKFSHHNWYIVLPIISLNFVRLGSAIAAIVVMIRLGHFSTFKAELGWLATLGLSVSSGVDIIVTASLWYYLRKGKTTSPYLNRVIDLLVVYAFETSSITCAATTIALICWLTMTNLIFMGIYFSVAKLFANSFLVTLNARLRLRAGGDTLRSLSLPFDSQSKISRTSKSVRDPPVPRHITVPALRSPILSIQATEKMELIGLPSPTTPRAF